MADEPNVTPEPEENRPEENPQVNREGSIPQPEDPNAEKFVKEQELKDGS